MVPGSRGQHGNRGIYPSPFEASKSYDRIANPAYGLLLIGGMAMTYMGKIPLTTPWVLMGLIFYVVLVVIAAVGYTPTLRRQIAALDAGGPKSPEYRRLEARSMQLGIVLAIVASRASVRVAFRSWRPNLRRERRCGPGAPRLRRSLS